MFTTNKFEIKPLGNSIIRIVFFNGADINLHDAEVIHENLIRLSEGKSYCTLLDAQHQFTTSSEAREFVAKKESGRIAFAIVTNSIANRLVGNFFIQFNKPIVPTKLFSEEGAAIKWLQEQKAILIP